MSRCWSAGIHEIGIWKVVFSAQDWGNSAACAWLRQHGGLSGGESYLSVKDTALYPAGHRALWRWLAECGDLVWCRWAMSRGTFTPWSSGRCPGVMSLCRDCGAGLHSRWWRCHRPDLHPTRLRSSRGSIHSSHQVLHHYHHLLLTFCLLLLLPELFLM